jgi:hypothetical protein
MRQRSKRSSAGCRRCSPNKTDRPRPAIADRSEITLASTSKSATSIQAADFYGKLYGLEGRRQAGSRCYFTCGPVTLQVVDVSSVGTPHPAAKALYFIVNDLDAVFARAPACA